MADISETLRNDFQDAEFAEVYAESFLDTYVATQIKVLREQNDLTQAELAAMVNTTQTVISRIENVNYSAWSVGTLKKLARAFHIRLHVSFETFGSLVDQVDSFGRAGLRRAKREDDEAIFGPKQKSVPAELVDWAKGEALPQPRAIQLAGYGAPQGQVTFPFMSGLKLVVNNSSRSGAGMTVDADASGASGADVQVATGRR